MLDEYFQNQVAITEGLPSVKYFADKACLSPNYFGDLIKKETGKTAQEYIQCRIIEFNDYIFIRLIACNELPFVETHTVIQQQFDVSHDELLAVFVNRMFQLDPDFMDVRITIIRKERLFVWHRDK